MYLIPSWNIPFYKYTPSKTQESFRTLIWRDSVTSETREYDPPEKAIRMQPSCWPSPVCLPAYSRLRRRTLENDHLSVWPSLTVRPTIKRWTRDSLSLMSFVPAFHADWPTHRGRLLGPFIPSFLRPLLRSFSLSSVLLLFSSSVHPAGHMLPPRSRIFPSRWRKQSSLSSRK